MNTPHIFDLDKPVVDIIISFCNPYDIVSIVQVCNSLHTRTINKAILYKLYNKWVITNLSVEQLRRDIPHLTYQDFMHDISLILPIKQSKKLHHGNVLCLNALKAGYSEGDCLEYLDITSIYQLLNVAIIASEKHYTRVLHKLLDSEFDNVRLLVNKLLHKQLTETYDIGSFIVYLPDTCDISVHQYANIVMSLFRDAMNTSERNELMESISSDSLGSTTPFAKAGYMIGQYLSYAELLFYEALYNLPITIPKHRTYFPFWNSLDARTLTKEDIIDANYPSSTLALFRPDLYILQNDRLKNATANDINLLRIHNPYYARRVCQFI